MKAHRWFIVQAVSLALVSFLFLACSERASDENKTDVNEAMADLQKEKQAFENEMEKKVAELNRQLGEMKGKTENATGKAREELQNQVSALEKDLNTAQDKLKDVKDATAENWKELKSGVEVAFDDLGRSFERASELFK